MSSILLCVMKIYESINERLKIPRSLRLCGFDSRPRHQNPLAIKQEGCYGTIAKRRYSIEIGVLCLTFNREKQLNVALFYTHVNVCKKDKCLKLH